MTDMFVHVVSRRAQLNDLRACRHDGQLGVYQGAKRGSALGIGQGKIDGSVGSSAPKGGAKIAISKLLERTPINNSHRPIRRRVIDPRPFAEPSLVLKSTDTVPFVPLVRTTLITAKSFRIVHGVRCGLNCNCCIASLIIVSTAFDGLPSVAGPDGGRIAQG